MVTINYGDINDLEYIDGSVSPQERSHVEQLIRREIEANQDASSIDTQTNTPHNLHPRVDQVLPLLHRHPSPLLNQEIERYEEEEDNDGPIIDEGIDMTKYTNFENTSSQSQDDATDYSRIYTSLSYYSLQERNLSLLLNNTQDINSLHSQYLQSLEETRDDYNTNLNNKRQKVAEVSGLRKKRQGEEFAPVNDYLQQRWRNGIKSVVDLGIEACRVDNASGQSG